MVSGLMFRIASASSSSSTLGGTTGTIALKKALVMLDERPATVIAEGNWQYRTRFISLVSEKLPIPSSYAWFVLSFQLQSLEPFACPQRVGKLLDGGRVR